MQSLRTNQASRSLIPILSVALLLIALDVRSYAQSDSYKVSNLRWQIGRDEISVKFDFQGSREDEYRVKMLLLRESDREFRYRPIFVTGKVGEVKLSDTDNEILWAYKKDHPEGFEGDDYYIELQVERVQSFPWLIAAGGAALAGVAIVLAVSTKSPSQPETFQLPFPPSRP